MKQQGLFGSSSASAAASTSPTKHTWFFALRPSMDDASRLHAFAGMWLPQHGVGGRRIAAERLHVTLELVGHDVDEATVEAAHAAADTIAFPSLAPRFDAVMTFSAPSGPCVMLGTHGLDEVRRLRTELAMAMADRGFAPSRAFEPHMTLSYDPRHRLERTPVEPIAFTATEFALVKSHIGLSRHEVLRTWPLR